MAERRPTVRPDEWSAEDARALLAVAASEAERAREAAAVSVDELAIARVRIAELEAVALTPRHDNGDLLRRLADSLRAARVRASSLGRETSLIRHSDLFDAQWYVRTYPDVAASGRDAATHYVRYGAEEGRGPGPLFSTADYLESNPDVFAARVNPLVHYLRDGRAEGRPVHHRGREAAMRRSPARRLQLGIVHGDRSRRAECLAAAARLLDADVTVMSHHELVRNVGIVGQLDVLIVSRLPASPALDAILAGMRAGAGALVSDWDELTIDPETADIEELRNVRTELATASALRLADEGVRLATAAAACTTAVTDELAQPLRADGTPVFIVRGGFDDRTFSRARGFAATRKRDGLVRIGLAADTDVTPSDFESAAKAVASVLNDHDDCRLVVFVDRDVPVIDLAAHPDLAALDSRIEWRRIVPPELRPRELARFDIAIAPAQIGNPFRESSSPLAFVDAALVDVPIIASPTSPFRHVIDHGGNGFLAEGAAEWQAALEILVVDGDLRAAIGRRAQRTALAQFGPRRRSVALATALGHGLGVLGGSHGVLPRMPAVVVSAEAVVVPAYGARRVAVGDGDREVTVAVLVDELSTLDSTLDSVVAQTLPALDLVVVVPEVNSAAMKQITRRLGELAGRFTAVTLAGPVASTQQMRDIAFDASETPFVLSLWAGDRLRARACEKLVTALTSLGAGFAWAPIEGTERADFDADRRDRVLLPGSVRQWATTVVAKEAWAAGGGFVGIHRRTNDQFWEGLLHLGIGGVEVPYVALDAAPPPAT